MMYQGVSGRHRRQLRYRKRCKVDNSKLYTTALEPGHVRLLTLYAGPPSSPIHTNLAVSKLTDDLAYEALSYAWDDQIPSEPILCDGNEVLVTQNVFDALGELRDELQTRSLWIDQVCINQEDDLEKSHQVLLMKEIYTNADRVIIWLGKEDPDTHIAFGFIDLLADLWKTGVMRADLLFIKNSSDIVSDVERCCRHLPHETQLLLARLPLFRSAQMTAIELLLSKTWFSRLWIIQEAVLGGNSSEYRCCRYSCSIRRWDDAFHAYDVCDYPDTLSYPSEAEHAENIVHLIRVLRSDRRSNSTRGSINYLLGYTSYARCKDSRDRIYALLGLVEPKLLDHIVPNYSMPVLDVYAGAVRAAILADTTLEILGRVKRWKSTDESFSRRPSWVPDLREPGKRHAYYLGRRKRRLPPSYNASDRSLPMMLASNDPSQLILQGVRLKEVTRRLVDDTSSNARPNPPDDKHDAMQHWQAMYCQGAKRLHLPFSCLKRGRNGDSISTDILFHKQFLPERPDDEKLLGVALRRTMTADFYSGGEPRTLHYDRFFPYLASWSRQEAGDVISRELMEEHEHFVDSVLRNRRLYIVGDEPHDGYLCLADADTRVGDWVCILFGGDVPYVLRPNRTDEGPDGTVQTWELIGECYVHGFMDGEALQGRDSSLHTESFVLV